MFGFFTSADKQMRDTAQNWLEVATRVYHYRRDQLTDAELADLQKKTETLRAQVRDKAEAGKLKLSIEALEPVLRRVGGRQYPNNAIKEWVEFFVVAAIALFGFRQFFAQPFKIPTNSMWPTYNGMVPEVHAKPADEPSTAARAFRAVAFGADAYRVDAPIDGEILIPVVLNRGGDGLIRTPSKGRQWLVFSREDYKYDLFVGNEQVSVSVPKDFDFRWLLRDAFAPDKKDIFEARHAWDLANQYIDNTAKDSAGNPLLVRFYRTGKFVKKGERVLSFDIITGDQLFVDRMSYHFVRPSVGSGFVFRTHNIPDTRDENGNHIDSYYIKRLAGVPGDKLQIRPPMLYRNGEQISGAKAFADNLAQVGKYRGYTNAGGMLLSSPSEIYTVSENGYVALGDNSNNSADSRFWGEVPKKDVVGRPLWIFYPFGRHWGPPH